MFAFRLAGFEFAFDMELALACFLIDLFKMQCHFRIKILYAHFFVKHQFSTWQTQCRLVHGVSKSN